MEHTYQARPINNHFHLSIKCVCGAQLEDQSPIYTSGDMSSVPCLCGSLASVSYIFVMVR